MERIVILGAGISGVGAAVLAHSKDYEVFVSDKGKISQENKELLDKYNISYEEGIHTESKILNVKEVIKSPGIPNKVSIIKKLESNNIPVISEIEFASRFTKAKIVGITGSNGKTTTTSLTYELLKNGGLNVGLGGNIGKSFAYQVATEKRDVYVLELSSFQLDGIRSFKPDVAVLLNITPDHLDRYNYEFKNYIESKFRIIQNLNKNDHFIYNMDDKVIMNYLSKNTIPFNHLPFSYKKIVSEGAWIKDDQINISVKKNFSLCTSMS